MDPFNFSGLGPDGVWNRFTDEAGKFMKGIGGGSKGGTPPKTPPASPGAIVRQPPVQQINTNLKVPGGRGLTIGRGNAALLGLGLLETALINSGTEYGKKVEAARAEQDAVKDDVLNRWLPGLFPKGGNESPQSSGDGRPKASGTVITIDGKRYDTGFHAKEIAELRKKYPGGGNAGQSQSVDPGKSSYIPPASEAASTPAPVSASTPAPTSAPAPARTPQSDNMDENFKIWAKANPTLAKKLKEGDYGYEAVQSVINPQSAQSGMTAAAALKDKYVDMFKGGGVSFDDAKDVPTGYASPDIKSNLPKDFFNQAAVNADFKQIPGLSGNAQQPRGNASFDQIPDFPSSGNQTSMSLPSGVNLYDQDSVNTNFAPIPGISQNSYQSYEDWSRSNTNPAEVGEKKVVFPADRRNLVGEDGTLDTGREDISDAPTIMGPNGVPVLDLRSYYKR